tara:strand:- start:1735 stop:2013 length:279 start_codon:yes stop_codon:yes gene_type:complete
MPVYINVDSSSESSSSSEDSYYPSYEPTSISTSSLDYDANGNITIHTEETDKNKLMGIMNDLKFCPLPDPVVRKPGDIVVVQVRVPQYIDLS